MTAIPDVLSEIVAHKRGEIAAAQQRVSAQELERRLADVPATRDFTGALHRAHPVGVIAEVKKASPSAGIIREDFDPVAIARTYADHGAACISVLTDEQFFGGRLEFLQQIREAVDVPLLRKDFILDWYQLLEARLSGADCVLLIAECLTGDELSALYKQTKELDLQCLIELYDAENLDQVLALDPPLIGINNRNLRTFVTDLSHTIELAPRIPPGTLLVSESGIHSAEDVRRLADHGVRSFLVGETLMRADDIGGKLQELLSAGDAKS